MNITGVEEDFLKEIREANPEDCKTVIEALRSLDGREDEAGELTTLGMLAAAIVEDLELFGVMKRHYSIKGANV